MTVSLEPGGPWRLSRKVEHLLPEAVRLVSEYMCEPMPDTTMRFARAGDFGPAVAEATGGRPNWWRALIENERQRRNAHTATGMTLPTAGGRVLILLNIPAMVDNDQVFPTLVHELVHAVQMGRPATAARTLARDRHYLGIERQSRRWLDDCAAALDRDEDEAYRIEHLLAAN